MVLKATTRYSRKHMFRVTVDFRYALQNINLDWWGAWGIVGKRWLKNIALGKVSFGFALLYTEFLSTSWMRAHTQRIAEQYF